MINIPVNAKIYCTDGICGKSTHVIIDPIEREVTHFVVQENESGVLIEHLVPIEYVEETTANEIKLTCTKETLSKMEKFIERRFIQTEIPTYAFSGYGYSWPFVTTGSDVAITEVDEQHLPPGELAINRGMVVEGNNGYVGRIGELLLDPQSRRVTHLVLEKGQLWGKKEIALPVSAVDRITEDTVYLKLSKEEIKTLPAIPLRRAWEEVDITDVELFVKIFDEISSAKEALQILRNLELRGSLEILNAAVVTKQSDGKTSYNETGDVNARRGALFGAITGGLLGLLGGPVGAVLGAAVGATTGGVAANQIDMGFPDEFLENVQTNLNPETSALIVLVKNKWVETVVTAIVDIKGKIFEQTLSDEMVDKYLSEIKEEGDT